MVPSPIPEPCRMMRNYYYVKTMIESFSYQTGSYRSKQDGVKDRINILLAGLNFIFCPGGGGLSFQEWMWMLTRFVLV